MFEFSVLSGFLIGLVLGTFLSILVGYYVIKRKLFKLAADAQGAVINVAKKQFVSVVKNVRSRNKSNAVVDTTEIG
jgi:hypothetical protein